VYAEFGRFDPFAALHSSWSAQKQVSGGWRFQVPAGFADVDAKVSGDVVWQGTFGSNTPDMTR
jgi:hypothetical protein